jgi:hypothetical protein
VDRPKFGKTPTHPVTFLEHLEIYLMKVATDGHELETAIECLEGAARDWARVYKDRWNSVADFKSDFLKSYWGSYDQNELRRSIVHGTWDRIKEPLMANYFIKIVGQTKMLSYSMSEEQLISDIIRHFPRYVQQSFITSKSKTILETAEFLRSMDEVNKQEFKQSNSTNSAKPDKTKKQTQYGNWRRPEAYGQGNVTTVIQDEEAEN